MIKPKLSGSLLRKKLRLALGIRVLFIVILPVAFYLFTTLDAFQATDISRSYANTEIRHQRKVLSVAAEVEIDSSTKHAINTTEASTAITKGDDNTDFNCTAPAIDEFPSDGFSRKQRRRGWIIVHIVLVCYCFWFLAIICDDYFVPAIENMCASFQMKEDVAGATFMAMATSSPELFINCVGTFITEGDLGVGTVVGAAVFNVLAVPACCGIFARQIVKLDWYPITRDVFVYAIAVLGLIGVLMDGRVMWYEAMGLVLTYFLYITILYYNDVMSRKAKMLVAKYRKRYRSVRPYKEVTEISPLLAKDNSKKDANGNVNHSIINGFHLDEDDYEFASSPWSRNDENCLIYVLKWPLTLLLWFTVPDCRRHPRLRYLTFATCIAYIGITSYVVSFFITVFGDTINIPDSVMGLTFLAAGTSVPEAVSSVIVTNQGHGAMGISNAIGSNTFDILLCLGIPWFVKATFFPVVERNYWIPINSSGITYSAISLLSTVIGLYIAFTCNKFKLDYRMGVTCAVMYFAFLAFASLIEMNVFFPVNPPTCGR